MFTFLPGIFLVQFSGPFYLSTDKWCIFLNKEVMNNVNTGANNGDKSFV